MRYSRGKITKAGNNLLVSKNEVEIKSSQSLINEWRADHLEPLEHLKNNLLKLIDDEGIIPSLVTQRLKRLISIVNKLDRSPDTELGGMQDIAGIRIVLDDMVDLKKVFDLLVKKDIGDFIYQRVTNYIEDPKSSGYRSIHFIYKHTSLNPIYDGLRFELQIRTGLQHYWATALETVDIHTKTPLKAGYGDDDWLEFFKLVSSLFAFKEGSPRLEDHVNYGVEEIMRKYYQHNKEKGHLEILQAFNIVISNPQEDGADNTIDYYLLRIDLEEHTVTVYSFAKDEFEKATKKYYDLESQVEENKNAVVLIATSSYQMLKEGYPSYFYDIKEFIASLKKVEENCERLGLTN